MSIEVDTLIERERTGAEPPGPAGQAPDSKTVREGGVVCASFVARAGCKLVEMTPSLEADGIDVPCGVSDV
jgi:hypothetical protein